MFSNFGKRTSPQSRMKLTVFFAATVMISTDIFLGEASASRVKFIEEEQFDFTSCPEYTRTVTVGYWEWPSSKYPDIPPCCLSACPETADQKLLLCLFSSKPYGKAMTCIYNTSEVVTTAPFSTAHPSLYPTANPSLTRLRGR